MAASQSPLNFVSPASFTCPSSSSSSSSQSLLLIPQSENHCYLNSFRTLKLRIRCTLQTIETGTQQNIPYRKKRKPRPSFLEQIQDKWSRKPSILIDKLPWEEERKEKKEGEEEECETIAEVEEQNVGFPNGIVSRTACEKSSALSQPVSSGLPEKVILPPWEHGNKPRKKSQFDNEARNSKKISNNTENTNGLNENSENFVINSNVVQDLKKFEEKIDLDEESGENGVKDDDTPIENLNGINERRENHNVTSSSVVEDIKKLEEKFNLDEEIGEKDGKDDDNPIGLSQKGGIMFNEVNKSAEINDNELGIFQKFSYVKGSRDSTSESVRLPWESDSDKQCGAGKRLTKSNTEAAERVISEPELKRLRNVSLRMVERIKVGAAGITQVLVDSIHKKWKEDEVVKLKFEGPTAMNMRWTHQILEVSVSSLSAQLY